MVQELATRPLTQDLLQEEVRKARSGAPLLPLITPVPADQTQPFS